MKKNIYRLALLIALIANVLPVLGQYTYIVAKDGSGNYSTIQAAITASSSNSSNRINIYVKAGTYSEEIYVPSNKTNITLVGESKSSVILVSYDTDPTLYIDGAGVYVTNMTIRNNYGTGGPANALKIYADKCIFNNCDIIANQDTYFSGNCRGYFTNCYIEGTTDFIYGAGKLVFSNCTIHSKGGTAITAASTESYSPYGFVFLNCTVTANSGVSTYLGRTWRPYAATAFLYCELPSAIKPEGWSDWGNASNQATARYCEYGNTGNGASTSSRVSWADILSSSQASSYTMLNVLKTNYANSSTDNWDPNVTINSAPSGSGTTNKTVNGTYNIIASHSGKALDVYAWGTSNGTNICQWSYWGGATQQFNIAPVDGEWHRITPVLATDKALDIEGVSTASGANLFIWSYWGGYGQQFRFQNAGSGVYRIIARHSDKCLDVAGASTSDGANVQQWGCTSGSAWQMFSLNRVSSNTELSENIADNVQIYPNPATNGNFSIALSEISETTIEVKIIDTQGRKVYSGIYDNNPRIKIQTDLDTGTYILQVVANDKSFIKKLIIQ